MTDYKHIATIATGVAACGVGAYATQMNLTVGGTLLAAGIAILTYKAAKKTVNTPPGKTDP